MKAIDAFLFVALLFTPTCHHRAEFDTLCRARGGKVHLYNGRVSRTCILPERHGGVHHP